MLRSIACRRERNASLSHRRLGRAVAGDGKSLDPRFKTSQRYVKAGANARRQPGPIGKPPSWIVYSPLPFLFLLMFTGLFMFVLPYAAKTRSR